MNPSSYRIRRATLDDVSSLRSLWEKMRFSAGELEKRLTEFQIVEGPKGEVEGALGFQVIGRYARIHSEAFHDFAIADTVRPLLWGRIQALALNHGVVRLWTQEESPFWTHNGFLPARAATLEKLPDAWERAASKWLTLQLKDEEAITSLEKEFALFMESEKQRSTRALDQARRLKVVVTIFAVLIAAGILMAAAYVYFTHRRGGSLTP